jgi:toxin ParE1/3/4
MFSITWSPLADADLEAITSFIWQRNPLAAQRMWQLIQDSVLPLAEHPYLYRQSERMPGCRQIVVHPNYIVVFQVSTDSIKILRVLHARQQFPD